jgi:type II secretory pathway component PulF
MPQFAYQAIAAAGGKVSGTLEAATRSEAYRQLEARQLAPLDLQESARSAPAAGTPSSHGVPRLNRQRLIFFTSELADLLDAGLPVQQSLTVMAEKQQDPAIRRVSLLVRQHLSEGQTLSASFRLASPSFDDLFTSLVAAGEASGSLGGVLSRMAQSMTQLQDLQRRFTSAMVYPAFMAGACALLMAVFTLFLVPQLTDLLSKTGQQLPAVTRLLLDFSHFCTQHVWTMLGGGAAVLIAFRAAIATPRGRAWWDRAKLGIPLIGPILETRFYAAFTQALGNLLTNGVPLLSALKLLVAGTSNRFFRHRLGSAIEAVSAGAPLSTALVRAGNFQPLMTDIIGVGEQTGHLARALQKAAGRYDKELDGRIKRLTAMVSPVIIIFLAVVVTLIAYCIVSSIFSAVSGIRAQTG